MSIGMDDCQSSKTSCSCRPSEPQPFPILSVVDLSAFEHEPCVEDTLHAFPFHASDKNKLAAEDDNSSQTSTTAPDLMSASSSSDGSSMSDGNSVDLRDIAPVKIPEFVDVYPEEPVIPSGSKVLRALRQFEVDLMTYDISMVEYYESLQITSVQLSPALPPRGHVDGGALATTTDRKNYLWSYHEYSEEERSSIVPRLRVADDTVHIPTGVGYICVPQNGMGQHQFIRSFYTPEIPASIISPDAFGKANGCRGYQTYSDFHNGRATLDLIDCQQSQSSMSFDLQLIRGLLFTDSLIAPTPSQHVTTEVPVLEGAPTEDFPVFTTHEDVPVRAMTRDQQRMLWHMRLGHVNERMVSDLHHYVDGIPALPRAGTLDSCAVCKRTKLHKANRGTKEEFEPTECWQDIQIDFGFFVTKSSGRAPPKKKSKAKKPVPTEKPTSAKEQVEKPTSAKDSTSSKKPTTVPNTRRYNTRSSKNLSPDNTVRSVSHELPMCDLEQVYNFEDIVAHQGPLKKSDKRYNGHPYNLWIKWSNGRKTWEPLHEFIRDAPQTVLEYAKSKGLMDTEHWELVHEVEDGVDNEDEPPPSPTTTDEVTDKETSPTPATMADLDDETELIDGTLLDEENTVFEPMDDSVAAAKAAAAHKRYQRLKGLNGETCYVLITDRLSGCYKVAIRRDKRPPLDFFKEFIATHATTAPNRRVRFDGGGDLGGNTAVHELFKAAGYDVEVTAPDSSSEIGLAERPHRTIADGVRTMLFAAGLDLNFWPYALRYFILISNCLPHGDRLKAAITMCTGKRINISLLRIFGCRIFALPSEDRDAKLDVHGRAGIFLGYKKSMRHAFYYDLQTKTVKTARHIAFDEGMSDMKKPPPFVQLLRGELKPDQLHLDDATADMQVSLSPFNEIDIVDCDFDPKSDQPLGFQIERCPHYLRAYVSSFNRPFGPVDTSVANKRYLGGYVLKVGKHFTFSPEDVRNALAEYSSLDSPPKTLPIMIARDQRVHLGDKRPPPLHLRPVDIRRVAALNLVAGEGPQISDSNSALEIKNWRDLMRHVAATVSTGATPPDPDDLRTHSPEDLLEMRKLVNDHMTDEERALPSFTRKNLMKLSNWDEWNAADRKQLDNHFDSGTIGKAVPRPESKPMSPSQVFRLVWARLVKASGVRKSRACLDGSKRAAPWLRMLVQTYSSCVELPCLRLFLAICAQRGYYITFGDVENAYQQSPPPSIDCFLEIDDTVYDWYLNRFGVKLDRLKDVIPLYRALQGHPEAGVLWERMITDILINKMGFKNTAHEKNLYLGTIDGMEILVCRQVDDFAAGSSSLETAEKFLAKIREHVRYEFAGMGIETKDGVYQRYNGIDVTQTRDYIKVGCESYIDRMLLSHGWDAPKHKDPLNLTPISPDSVNRLMTLEGPKEKTPEAKELISQEGFSYRNVLGELIYAYVVARLDIGYAVCLLARFSQAPHKEHYRALKQVCRYLRSTKSWGILYQRPSPLSGLPVIPFEYLEEDPNLPPFPFMERDELLAMLDAAHATELKSRRSVTGLVIFFCCAAIAWKSRVQPIVATSSTEAEFYAAVTTAKIVKYLRYVLQELHALRPGPTRLLIDNLAALCMINEDRPTPRARHIEIQHFAIQEWRKQEDLIMEHVSGTINSSDDLTKALGWVLHARHARRSMGHYRIGSQNSASTDNLLVPYARAKITEAGEGVGTQFEGDKTDP